MRSSRIHTPAAKPNKGSSSKLMLLCIVALLLLGLAYLFLYIQTMMFKSKFDAALSEKVIDTMQYRNLSATSAHKFIKRVVTAHNLQNVQSYVTIQPRDEFNTIGSYFLGKELRGHKSAQSMRSKKVPGCSNIDALPPGTTLKSLSASTAAGQGSMLNRAGAAAAKDGTAMITGNAPTTSTPPGAIVFAIDLLFTFKYKFFKRKMWFHRRCYFYGERRRNTPVDEISKALKGQ